MTFKLVDIYRLMDNARTNLPGALDGAIQQEIFNTMSDFCNKTNLWYEDISFAVADTNVRGSTIDIQPTAGRINRLLYVLDADTQQRRMTMPTPGTLLFVDAPNAAATWTARCALSVADPVPTSGNYAGIPQAPDWLLERYHLGLLAGTLSAMMAQVGKSYSNIKMAGLHMAKYKAAVSEGKNEARHQNLYAGQTWRFPAFGVGRMGTG